MKKNKERLQCESIIEKVMVEILSSIKMLAPNTQNVMEFDLDGHFHIKDNYGDTLKKYKKFESAINWLIQND